MQALKDQNSVASAIFESSTTPGLTERGQIDQITGRILVDASVGGGTEVPTGTVNGSNTVFTTNNVPLYVVVDGLVRFPGFGYTLTGTGPYTITTDPLAPPTEYIESVYQTVNGTGSITVTDGVTTLQGITEVNFTSGATVSSGGGGIANVAISGGGGTGFQQPTGTVNGTNTIFVFATAPKAISVDQGRVMQKVSSDGTVNWTGTTTITLTVAPTFDIFSVA